MVRWSARNSGCGCDLRTGHSRSTGWTAASASERRKNGLLLPKQRPRGCERSWRDGNQSLSAPFATVLTIRRTSHDFLVVRGASASITTPGRPVHLGRCPAVRVGRRRLRGLDEAASLRAVAAARHLHGADYGRATV